MGKYLEVPGADYSTIAIAKVTPITPVVGKTTIVVVANPTAGGSVTGSGSYDAGTQISISATASEGYVFSKWSDNDTNATRSITVGNVSKTYTAVFAINKQYSIPSYSKFENYSSNPFQKGKKYSVTLTFDKAMSWTDATIKTYFKLATTNSNAVGASTVEVLRRWYNSANASAASDAEVAGFPSLTNTIEFECTQSADYFVVYTDKVVADYPVSVTVSAVEI